MNWRERCMVVFKLRQILSLAGRMPALLGVDGGEAAGGVADVDVVVGDD